MNSIIRNYKSKTGNEVSLNIVIDHGEGIFLIDKNAKKYLDFSSGFGVVNLGYGNPELINVICEQSMKNCFLPPWLPTEEGLALADLLLQITRFKNYQCIRATGGGDANEVAYRIAMANKPGKILSFYYSYHGGSQLNFLTGDTNQYYYPKDATLNLHKIQPVYDYRHEGDFETAQDRTLSEIEIKFKTDTYSCLILEPVIGSGGIISFPRKAIHEIHNLCKKYNVLLIFDEVITGFGRSGNLSSESPNDTLFAFQSLGIEPDILTLAKGMSSGYSPIGACLARFDLMKKFHEKYNDITSTFAWQPLPAKVAERNIQLILDGGYSRKVKENENYFKNEMANLFYRWIPQYTGEVRGAGYMIGVELVKDLQSKEPNKILGHRIILGAKNEGLLIAPTWKSHILIFLPPLITTRSDFDMALEKLERTLLKHAKSRR